MRPNAQQRRFNHSQQGKPDEAPAESAGLPGEGSSHPKIRAAQRDYWETFEKIIKGNKQKTPKIPMREQPVKKLAVKKPSAQLVMAKHLERIEKAEQYLSDLEADEVGEPNEDGARLHTMKSDGTTQTTTNPEWFRLKSGASLETVDIGNGQEKILISTEINFKMHSALQNERFKLASQPLPGRPVQQATAAANEWGDEQD